MPSAGWVPRQTLERRSRSCLRSGPRPRMPLRRVLAGYHMPTWSGRDGHLSLAIRTDYRPEARRPLLFQLAWAQGKPVATRPRQRFPRAYPKTPKCMFLPTRESPATKASSSNQGDMGSRLGVSPAPHLAFRIFMSFKGFFFLLCHSALCLFAPSTGFFLLSCAQLVHLFCGGVVLGRVGTHRWWPPSHTLGTPTASW